MTVGRKPKATTIRERLRGSALPPTTNARLPNPPGHLDDQARQEWRKTGKRLLAAGLLSGLDLDALAIYCVSWARWRKSEDALAELPSDWPAGTDAQKGKAYLRISRQAMATMLRLMSEFGMTPASRSRLPATERRPTHKVPEAPSKPGEDPRKYLRLL